MIQNVTIRGEIREGTGKGVAHKLRAAGKLPVIVYGKGLETRPLCVDHREFVESLKTGQGTNVLMTLEVPSGGELNGKTVMVRELQRDPLTGTPLHADLIEVRLDETVRVDVRLRFVGKPVGVEQGGILQELHRHLEVECLPTAIPDHLEVDVASLEIGKTLHLSDITLPVGVTPLADEKYPLATVIAARLETPAAGEEEKAEEGEGAKEEAASSDEKKE